MVETKSLGWEPFDEIQVLKVWLLDGADLYPHIALLRVSTDDYQAFAQDPNTLVTFVNDHKIFPDTVNGTGPWVALSSLGNAVPSPGYVLKLMHQKTSMMIVVAVPNVSGGS
jgi:hypothetical protein